MIGSQTTLAIKERAEIQQIRKDNPDMGAFRLAGKIYRSEFGFKAAPGRSLLSVYSVIRRFDAAQKTKKEKGGAKLARQTAGV